MVKRDSVLRQLTVSDLVEVVETAALAMNAHAVGLDRLDDAIGPGSGDGSPGAVAGGAVAGDGDALDGREWGEVNHGNTGRHLTVAMAAWAKAIAGTTSFTDFVARTREIEPDTSMGTSGSLFIEFAHGFVDVCRNVDTIDAGRFGMALEVGAEEMGVVSRPKRSGTMIDVAETVAAAALASADGGSELADVTLAAAESGLDALERTPEQSPELAAAGVVDAGGAGFLVMLDAFVSVIHGEDPELPEWEFPELDDPDGEREATERYRYQISLQLNGAVGVAAVLNRAWMSLGDQVDVNDTQRGGEPVETGYVRASVQSDDIGAVIEAAIALGRVSNIVVADTRS